MRPGLGLNTYPLSAGSTSTSRAITHGTQIKGWLKVGSDPSEYPETASARLSVHEFPFRAVSPGNSDTRLSIRHAHQSGAFVSFNAFSDQALHSESCGVKAVCCKGGGEPVVWLAVIIFSSAQRGHDKLVRRHQRPGRNRSHRNCR
jgi:hypothetical protein